MRVLVCFVALATVLAAVRAATTGKRPGQATPVIQTQTSSGKDKGRTVMHPAFTNAGKTPGVEIWRIQSFEPVAYPKEDYGKFYTGDSYIVLVTKQNKNGDKSWDLHFWLGLESTADESGAAAALTVQLDDQLGGAPVQYREVQEHESQLFKSHFKNGLRYLSGGVASGFRHVDNTVQKKLYQVKGKRNIRVKQVEFSVASMNKGDCFILDAGNDIYVYVGKNSKRVEKLKAISAANLIRDQDHGGRSKVHVVDEFSTEDEHTTYFQVLGSGSSKQIPEESVGGDDEQFERSEESNVFLYKVTDASGKMKVDKLTEKPLKQEQLDANDCFILDTENADVYVWVGKKCNAQEKSEAMSKAQNFIATKKYPAWTRVQRVVENAEPSIFRQYFQTWRGFGELHSRLIRSIEDYDFYLRAFHCKLLSNGKLISHEVSDIEQQDLDEDDVVILDNGSDVFVWLGKDSSTEERQLSIEKAQKFKNINNRNNVNIVEEGSEQENFISLFPTWDANYWNTLPTYEQRKNEILSA